MSVVPVGVLIPLQVDIMKCKIDQLPYPFNLNIFILFQTVSSMYTCTGDLLSKCHIITSDIDSIGTTSEHFYNFILFFLFLRKAPYTFII